MKNSLNHYFSILFLITLGACIPIPDTIPTALIEIPAKEITSTPESVASTSTATPTPIIWHYGPTLTYHLNDMTVLPNGDFWVIGDPGIILHNNGDLEIRGLYEYFQGDLDVSTLGFLMAIDFISSDDGWMISSLGGIFHWNGNEWINVRPNNHDVFHALRDIKFADTDSGWAVGCTDTVAQDPSGSLGEAPVLLQWNGEEWMDVTSLSNLGANDCLYSIDVISENDVWILGDHFKDSAIVLHWNGLKWQRIPVPESMHGRNNISASSDENVWVVADTGNIGTNAFYWNGTTWQKTEMPFPELPYLVAKRTPEILAFAPNDVWAGGSGVFHWDGNKWKVIMPYYEKFGFVVDIESVSEGTVWILTQKGTIFELKKDQ